MTAPKRIFYVHYGDNWIRGSEIVLLDLLTNLDRDRFEPIVWSNCQPLLSRCKDLEICTYYSPFDLVGGWRSPRWNIGGWNNLFRRGSEIIKEHKIDLVHVNSGGPCQWMCLAARINRTPLLAHLHCHYILRDRFSLGLHLTPRLLCVSKDISKEILKDGYPPEHIHIVYNGVSLDQNAQPIDIKSLLGIPSKAFTFLSVGSLIKRKGFDRLIQAIRMHNYHQNNPHLVIIGEGEDHLKLQQLAMDLKINDRIHFVGAQDNVDNWMLGNAEAFISGSYEEAFGLALGEAALAKLPIVAPITGGIPELFQHKHSAVLYKNTGMAGLLNAIQLIIQDSSLRNKVADNAFNFASQHLTVEGNARVIESIYINMLQKIDTNGTPVFHCMRPISRWLQTNYN
ncbi:glycosyltransferase [Vibrio sagamiensis]|uniref:Glycosyl transferase n=1 Tax=Vibrio sagamiensis NBRC 104589 TaxID=1219064 RepID=A0A511QDN9_9VIBR|nr:glycosyltransferase [Vibrio sagamiensis]PNQ53846.1 glycosyltransferase [Vibrio agarivorans]GEM75410.1 glycosyl transferase [Vibrio sagamiensis NBRC 104589]